MIQAPHPQGLHYGVQLAAGVAVGTRLPRAVQSASAADLLAELERRSGIAAGWTSKAHSRAMSAAAISREGSVGIDVEYEAPGRDIRAVGRWLLNGPVADEAAAYRVFTFREAYFKATGDWALADLLRVAAESQEPRYRTPDGFNVLHETPASGFVLTLVWRGAGSLVRHELPEEAEGRL
jgi:hypothetical protein